MKKTMFFAVMVFLNAEKAMEEVFKQECVVKNHEIEFLAGTFFAYEIIIDNSVDVKLKLIDKLNQIKDNISYSEFVSKKTLANNFFWHDEFKNGFSYSVSPCLGELCLHYIRIGLKNKGNGLGSGIMQYLMNQFFQSNVLAKKVIVKDPVDSALIFYKKLGFKNEKPESDKKKVEFLYLTKEDYIAKSSC